MQKLLDRAARGQLRLPSFQRPLKWTIKHNLLLLDSVAKGFPIGTLLFWEKQMEAGRVVLGNIEFDAAEVQRSWLIVDGQQRVSALVGSMLKKRLATDQFSIGYDLESARFHHLGVGKHASSVPLAVLGLPELLLKWLDESGIRDRVAGAAEKAFRVSTQLRDYEIAAYVIETADEAVVREVFDRLNTSGRKLTHDEVFEAIDQPDGTGLNANEVQRRLHELRFGRLSKKLIIKSLAAVLGEDVTQAFRPHWTPAEREKAWRLALEGLQRAIIFLRRDGGVPHLSLLPYSLPLVILARFFALHPQPHSRNRLLLSRWLWRGFVHGTHQGQSIPLVRKMVAAVTTNEDESVQALLDLVPADRSNHFPEGKVSLKTARTRLELLVLLSDEPRSFETGEVIDVLTVIEQHGPGGLIAEIVPRRSDSAGRSIMNRFFVEGRRPPSLDALPEERLAAVLSSQRMVSGPLDAVLDRREDDLINHIHDEENRRMGFGEPDRGPLRLALEDGDYG